MSQKEQGRQLVAELVEKYKRLPPHHKLNEQELRLGFVLPLFQALGWDIHQALEVSAEEQIVRGRADFGFYFGGSPVFYLETKRAEEDLNKPEWGRQAISYAWLKGVTWAVLCNFKHLKVFNAEVAEKKPSDAIFLNLSWENYANTDFEDLWLLSKESIASGALNALAERYGKKAQKEPVTRLLFAQMTVWRRDLFKEMQARGNLWKNNPRLLDEAIQRFLDRLIFIRTMEDRQVEPPRLQAVLRQYKYKEKRKTDKNLFRDLQALFSELDQIYNARLFAPHALDLLEFYDAPLLENIITRLYEAPGAYDRYDFSSINADVLGSIYEQYLRFKALDPHATQALEFSNGNGHGKNGKRKLQGIYYTPQYVVRYIVQNTVGKLLENGADPYQLRILDPACGSGAFLLEAFALLDRWLAQYGRPEDRDDPYRRRLGILQNNLYGVDLDPQAIEVAQLNLLLRAAHMRQRLPMLDHLRVGNSLIAAPLVAGDMAFDWEGAFKAVMDEGGFDVILGNPPYIPIEYMSVPEKTYYQEQYPQLKRKYDSSVIFILLAMQKLLKPGGRLGFISSITWQTGQNYEALREYLLREASIDTLINLPFDVFPDAYVDTGIYLLQKGQALPRYQVYLFPKKTPKPDLQNLPFQSVPREMVQAPGYKLILDLTTAQIREHIQKNVPHHLLGDISISTQGLAASRYEIKSQAQGPDDYPFMVEGTLARYELTIQKQSYASLSSHPSLKRFYEAGPKLLIRRIISRQDRLMVAYTEQAMVFTKDINPFIPQGSQLSPFYLLGLLNSRLISYLYVNSSSIASKDDFRQTTLSELRQLPIATAEPHTHDQIVTAVHDLLDLKPKYQHEEAQKSDMRHVLKRQVEDLETHLDSLVYGLYRLNDSQIQGVEAYFSAD